MTKPLRVALALLPFLSVGLLSWLPALYLYLRRPDRRTALIVCVIQFATTLLLLGGLLTADPSGVKYTLYAVLYAWLVFFSALIAWTETALMAKEETPAPDKAA